MIRETSPAFIPKLVFLLAIAFHGVPANADDATLTAKGATSAAPASSAASNSDREQSDRYKKILKDAESIAGLIPMYKQDGKLFAELSAKHYRNEYIVLISIARGIGRDPLYGGMTWGYGDDWVWKFRKTDDRLMIVRRNVRFRAEDGTPAATAIKYAYTDSVLFSLPILAKGPKGGDLVDLSSVFMSDLPQISRVLNGFTFSRDKSTWADVKGFTDNAEIQVAATYASNGRREFDSVPDSRGVTLNVHYSISRLKKNGYKPREADDRIGYFLTVVKDYSKSNQNERFVRYINRWKLEKADPDAELSPPKEPIVFWLENTIPFKYRKTIRDGFLEWNNAFEKAGFADAIEVRQQPDDAEWDAEDVNYNTFRWITSSAGFAMGPSRVNPYTGQILDADIIFDADFLQYWKREFETFTPDSVAELTGGPLEVEEYQAWVREHHRPEDLLLSRCRRRGNVGRQFAFGSAALGMTRDADYSKAMEEMVMQGLKGTVMHEVGHTLGLRHNFKGSAWRSMQEINGKSTQRLLASVMDYDAVNIALPGRKQGNYFTRTIGPYDEWAIEYGYKQFSGNPRQALVEIASRSGEPGLDYATDEDTRGIDFDPLSNRWDLGQDPLEFAQRQTQLVQELLPKVVDNLTSDGEDYANARRGFNVLLSTHGQALYFVSRFVGGIHTSRSHRGDANAKPPMQVVSAKKQREALAMISDHVFSDEPFEIPPEIYNYLMGSRWVHWGAPPTSRANYPIHDMILMWQARVLNQLTSGTTLARLHDSELQLSTEDDCLTTAELLDTLTNAIFAEVFDASIQAADSSNREPAISSLRRNLQRVFMKRLAQIALGRSATPEDCQTLAYYELSRLNDQINTVLDKAGDLDTYSRAHLLETSNRIQKVLDAMFTQFSP